MDNNKYDFIAVFDNHTDFTAPGAFSLYIDPDSLNLEL